MSRNANRSGHASHSWSHAELRAQAPQSLRLTQSIGEPFDYARDPLIRKQLEDERRTESQRRESQGRESQMVKLHRPFPELRPKQEQGPLRAAFNASWLKEQRSARMAEFRAQALERQQQQSNDNPTMEYAKEYSR